MFLLSQILFKKGNKEKIKNFIPRYTISQGVYKVFLSLESNISKSNQYYQIYNV